MWVFGKCNVPVVVTENKETKFVTPKLSSFTKTGF